MNAMAMTSQKSSLITDNQVSVEYSLFTLLAAPENFEEWRFCVCSTSRDDIAVLWIINTPQQPGAARTGGDMPVKITLRE